MTPNARYAAAIEILNRILDGEPAEKILTNWARSNRYAGSKDRAAVRDIVFDCLRQKRSLMHIAGFKGARGLIVGHILAAGQTVADVFTGERFAAEVLTDVEQTALETDKTAASDAVRLDVPDWIVVKLQTSLGDRFETSLSALQTRAPLDLRVNPKKADFAQVQSALAQDGIETHSISQVPNALRVTTNPRRVALSEAYKNGLVEIQDAGSQAVVDALPLEGVETVLDYCAGGGGKSLAIAARADVRIDAYDQNTGRMRDLSMRAKRAGAIVHILQDDPVLSAKLYDLVLLDVPCSGTGAWRRNPDGKWRFNATDLQALIGLQAQIITSAQRLVKPGGLLVYITCSLLEDENEAQLSGFLKQHSGWQSSHCKRLYPSDGTDGFYVAILSKLQL